MVLLPVRERFQADPPAPLRAAVEGLATTLAEQRKELVRTGEFEAQVVLRLADAPTLHLDDLSEIARLDQGDDIRFYQDRALLRAGDGDVVASCADPVPGYAEYCRDHLGLGSPEWLRPQLPRNPLRIAEACWEDEHVRSRLLRKLWRGELRYVHPHMGTFAVWELAKLLSEESGRPLKVIAPPPGVTRWANDKVAFTETVARLFGPALVPQTESVWNLAGAARRVKDISGRCMAIGLKLPHAGGGGGNLVLDADFFRGRPLPAVRQTLQRFLSALEWNGASQLLIDSWETEVIGSPSAQLWIPPSGEGPPVVEGIFVQTTEGPEGVFVGAVPARFPPALNQEIADRCWLLARLFQLLGYVGRCSFDMILVGNSLLDCRLEFIECNGRWGGTSIPMMLMSRIFGDWAARPFAVQVYHHLSGLQRVSLEQLLRFLGPDLFDVRNGTGMVIVYNPGRLRYQAGISAILLGATWEEAARAAGEQMPERLRQLVRAQTMPPTERTA